MSLVKFYVFIEVAYGKVPLRAKGVEIRMQMQSFLCGGRSKIFCRSSAVKGPGKLASVEKDAKITKRIKSRRERKGCVDTIVDQLVLERLFADLFELSTSFCKIGTNIDPKSLRK